ncbi:hypothetical protein FGG78_21870 [Thioclava sp. BHET1]|nr:hypothetical protein FGG78_21870 [Thioclava sp. BHET1]
MTIRAQAAAVVRATEGPDYLSRLEAVFRANLPVNLIAGARSAAEWDCPDWANRLCALRLNLPGVGHLMMAEAPEAYARAVQTAIRNAEA